MLKGRQGERFSCKVFFCSLYVFGLGLVGASDLWSSRLGNSSRYFLADQVVRTARGT